MLECFNLTLFRLMIFAGSAEMPMESVVSQVMEKGIPGVVGHEFSQRRQDHPIFVMDANENHHMLQGHHHSSQSIESMPSSSAASSASAPSAVSSSSSAVESSDFRRSLH
jgi:hypothetical protein